MNASVIRHPAVSGRFYPADPEVLREQVEGFLNDCPRQDEPRLRAIGCIAPHAGYMYSGHVAGAVFSALEIPRRCLILCPNHTGVGVPLAILSEGAWETPAGYTPIDEGLAAALKQAFPALQEDSAAHRAEHAIEVELPFLQLRRPDLSFVPIALGTSQFEPLAGLGHALAEVIRAQGDSVLIIASSDMNHYESDEITRVKDHQALERILALDPRGLYDVVIQQKISMCGFGPAVSMLTAARELGAKSAQLVKYATSGDVSGNRKMVVGYAGVVIS